MTNIPQYTLVRSARKTIALIVNFDTTVTVRAPFRVSVLSIEKFLLEKYSWICSRQELMRKSYVNSIGKRWVEGEDFLYLGQQYSLRIGEYQDISCNEDRKEIYFPKKFLCDKEKKTVDWYKKQAQNILTSRADHYSAVTNLTYTKLKITSATKRWGSCRGSAINFTWRLIMAPKY